MFNSISFAHKTYVTIKFNGMVLVYLLTKFNQSGTPGVIHIDLDLLTAFNKNDIIDIDTLEEQSSDSISWYYLTDSLKEALADYDYELMTNDEYELLTSLGFVIDELYYED